MSRQCAICVHPERRRIELKKAYGATLEALGSEFGVHRQTLWRHWRDHVADNVKATLLTGPMQIEELKERAAAEAGSVLDYLRIIRAALVDQFCKASEANATGSTAMLAGRLLETLRDIAKVTGEIAEYASKLSFDKPGKAATFDPIHSIERAVLGAILVDNEQYKGVTGRFDKLGVNPWLKPEHFSSYLNRCIYELIGDLIGSGRPATYEAIKELLHVGGHIIVNQGDGRHITASQYLDRLAEVAVSGMQTWQDALALYVLARYRERHLETEARRKADRRLGKSGERVEQTGDAVERAPKTRQSPRIATVATKPNPRVPRFISIEDENKNETVE